MSLKDDNNDSQTSSDTQQEQAFVNEAKKAYEQADVPIDDQENVLADKIDEEDSNTTTKSNDKAHEKEDFEAKYKALNDKYLRAYADFDNSKKRLEKDKYNAISYAVELFAKDIITVMDNLLLALQSTQNSEANSEDLLKTLKEGIDLTAKNLEKMLNKHDIQAIDTSGEFDPNIHNAVSKVKSDKHNSGEIVEVLQMGYTLKEKVIRAAMVSIAE